MFFFLQKANTFDQPKMKVRRDLILQALHRYVMCVLGRIASRWAHVSGTMVNAAAIGRRMPLSRSRTLMGQW